MTHLTMPQLEVRHLRHKQKYVDDFIALLGEASVVHHTHECRLYESDALNCYTAEPLLVLLPATTKEVADILRYCHQAGLPVVARGAGTSLTGGALPLRDGVVLSLARMREILDYDPQSRLIRLQPGVTNLAISDYVKQDNLFYAPDPSSQLACTIGGNVAMNSGGAHSLKYGVTTNNIVGATVVLSDGEICHVGSAAGDEGGIDLLSLIIGSEGTLGVVTEVTARLLPKPLGAKPVLLGFADNPSAGACVAAILAAGIIPVAIEFIDRPTLEAIENYAQAGYPLDCEAVLIVEVEGSDEEISVLLEQILKVAKKFSPQYQRVARTEAERESIWKGRKTAFSSIGAISPDYFCIDGVIPHGQLERVLREIAVIGQRHGLRIANIFHAGDGNLHPLILFDASIPAELKKAEKCGEEILKLCVDVGGCLSGEHGIGVEKRHLMFYQFDHDSLEQHYRIKRVFDADFYLNRGKMLDWSPTPSL